MIQCKRLGYAVLTTTDLECQLAYYTEVLGLAISHRDKSHVVFSTQQGVDCLVLRQSNATGLSGLAFEISPKLSLEDVQSRLQDAGVHAEIRDGAAASVPRAVCFRDPKGTELELFNSWQFGTCTPSGRGANPLKLGHVAYFVPEVDSITEFYVSKLGFLRSDWRTGSAMFLRCSTDHHTVNFFKGNARLGHIAFEVKDFADLVRASDFLIQRGYPLDWGPARHTIGHNCACYHSNGDGMRIELYAEMDQMLDEELGYFDPKPWHEDRPQRPKNWGVESSPRNKWIPSAP